MFANLKNKILEEVKASPQKFQQMAQAAQAAVSSASSTASDSVSGSDNFFSITEEDTPQNSPHKTSAIPKSGPIPSPLAVPSTNSSHGSLLNNGIPTNRIRRLSNSSVASDVSFRLPSYDSPAVYHLQSDLDISASEVEDTGGPSPAQLDLISKEHLHNAYKKSLDRYQKYRARYTELAKRYRELERDSAKARSVLVETQDKAIRRISELREQCSLEQQAKAHLEEALRMEMDDMQCKIKSYQTKLKLLGETADNIVVAHEPEASHAQEESLIKLDSDDDNNLISLENEQNQNQAIENENGNGTSESSISLLNEKILKLEDLLSKFKQKVNEQNGNLSLKSQEIDELKQKLEESDTTIDELKKREEENVLLLAQNKLMIHSELDNKESEVKKLKAKISEFENKLQNYEKENSKLRAQGHELGELQTKFKQLTVTKQDFEAKIISNEHILGELNKELKEKEKQYENKRKVSEEKLKSLSMEYEDKFRKLQAENDVLNEMIERSNKSEIDLAQIDNELNRTKTENDALKERADDLLKQKMELQQQLEENREQLSDKEVLLNALKHQEDELKRQKDLIKEQYSKESQDREQEIKQLKADVVNGKMLNESTESEAVKSLQKVIEDEKARFEEKYNVIKEELEQKNILLQENDKKIIGLNEKLANSEGRVLLLSDEEKIIKENLLKHEEQLQKSEEKIAKIVNDKTEIEIAMEKEKIELKSQVTNILQEISRMEEEMKLVKKSHAELEDEKRSLEKKFEKMSKANQEGKEGSQKWQTLLKQAEENCAQLEAKLQSVENENAQLAENSCLLQENLSRIENLLKENESNFKKEKSALNEIIKKAEIDLSGIRVEHETSNETIKKLNEKMSQVLDENSRLHNAKEIMEHEYRSLQDTCEVREKEKLCVLDSNKCLDDGMKKLRDENEKLKHDNSRIGTEHAKLRKELDKMKEQWKTKEEKLKTDRQQNISVIESKNKELTEKCSNSLQEINDLKEKIRKLKEDNKEVKREVVDLQRLREQLEKTNLKLTTDNNEATKSASESKHTMESELKDLKTEKDTLTQENRTLKEHNEALSKEIDLMKNQTQTRLTELETLLKRTNDEKQTLKESIKNATDLEKKLQNYEELKIENEYLNTLTNQLENDLRKLNDDKTKNEAELIDLREKCKSQQCELYVLNEGKQLHETQMNEKIQEIETVKSRINELDRILSNERDEARRDSEHSIFITMQNDKIQKELLLYQEKLVEAERLCGETRLSYEEVLNENNSLKKNLDDLEESSTSEISILNEKLDTTQSTIDGLTKDLKDITKHLNKLQNTEKDNEELQLRIKELETEISEKAVLHAKTTAELSSIPASAIDTHKNSEENEKLREHNSQLQNELQEIKRQSSGQISNLNQEIDDLTANINQLTDKLTDYERLRENIQLLNTEIESMREQLHKKEQDSASSSSSGSGNESSSHEIDSMKKERDDLELKLKKIMHEVQDVSNRNLFLEQKCENYLILEQSNERLKTANEKLLRQLDETLVSMHHNEGISANTEFEYLKNIMFQYLTGNVNGNNTTLVKVIAAVLKFSPQQTQVVIEKENQRNSLLGQINNLL